MALEVPFRSKNSDTLQAFTFLQAPQLKLPRRCRFILSIRHDNGLYSVKPEMHVKLTFKNFCRFALMVLLGFR